MQSYILLRRKGDDCYTFSEEYDETMDLHTVLLHIHRESYHGCIAEGVMLLLVDSTDQILGTLVHIEDTLLPASIVLLEPNVTCPSGSSKP